VWKAVVSVTVSALWAVPAPAHAAAPTGAVVAAAEALSPSETLAPTEAELMSLLVTQTNQRRHAAGCGQLDVERDLIVASLRQSDYMADTGRFSHVGRGGSTFVARARAAGYAAPAGENIAWGYRTATEVMDAWMASPAHRRNILNCDARSIGTGVRHSSDGTPYYTQVFGWR
jgi:uncharacterized protein YkwD